MMKEFRVQMTSPARPNKRSGAIMYGFYYVVPRGTSPSSVWRLSNDDDEIISSPSCMQTSQKTKGYFSGGLLIVCKLFYFTPMRVRCPWPESNLFYFYLLSHLFAFLIVYVCVRYRELHSVYFLWWFFHARFSSSARAKSGRVFFFIFPWKKSIASS